MRGANMSERTVTAVNGHEWVLCLQCCMCKDNANASPEQVFPTLVVVHLREAKLLSSHLSNKLCGKHDLFIVNTQIEAKPSPESFSLHSKQVALNMKPISYDFQN